MILFDFFGVAFCEQAVEYVESGMVLGLGTGSTAAFAVAKIGELLKVCEYAVNRAAMI